MADDPNEDKRWVPWTREADEKAKLYSAIAGLFLAVITSGSGVLRVGKFTLSDHLNSVKYERQVTEAQIADAIRKRKKDCEIVRSSIENRLDAIEQVDTVTVQTTKTCQEIAKDLSDRVRYLELHMWENKK